MNFFDHKNLGNHLLQLCPKVVEHPVYYVPNSFDKDVNGRFYLLLWWVMQPAPHKFMRQGDKVQKKKLTLEQAVKTQKSRVIALHNLQPRRWMGVGSQWHTPTDLPPAKRTGTHYTKRWVRPRAILDRYEKSCSHRNSIPGPFSP